MKEYCLGAIFVAILSGAAMAQSGTDRHAGYYYPEPVTEETYVARAVTASDSVRETRLGFVTALTKVLRLDVADV